MTFQTTAAVISEQNGSFSLETVELDDMRKDEILVRIEACGVCHTDMKAQGMTPLPAVFGHEGTGVVESIGAGVTRVKVGDRVVISYPWCGVCPSCMDGHAYICDNTFPLCFSGSRLDGSKAIKLNGEKISSAFFQQSSFANHSITSERNVVPIIGDHSAEMLAAIPCGVQTGAGAILNTFKAGPKDSLVVFGAGAVGLSAVMAGRLVGTSPLIVIDVVEDRLNLALELGATHTINAQQGDIAKRILDIIPRGGSFSLETSSNKQAFLDAIACLGTRGECGFVAIPNMGQDFPFSPQTLFRQNASLRGIIQGFSIAHTFLPRILELNRMGQFPYERLIKTYKFEDINKAFEDSKSGIAIKPVLLMD